MSFVTKESITKQTWPLLFTPIPWIFLKKSIYMKWLTQQIWKRYRKRIINLVQGIYLADFSYIIRNTYILTKMWQTSHIHLSHCQETFSTTTFQLKFLLVIIMTMKTMIMVIMMTEDKYEDNSSSIREANGVNKWGLVGIVNELSRTLQKPSMYKQHCRSQTVVECIYT